MKHFDDSKAHRPGKRVLTALISAFALVLSLATPALALENTTDTVWGTVPATAYMTKAFYEEGNTIDVPKSYIDSIEGDDTYSRKVSYAYNEVYKQSTYLLTAQTISLSEGDDFIRIERRPIYSEEKERMIMDTLETTADSLVAQLVNDTMTDYEKAVKIYDYVRSNTTYDWDAFHVIRSDDWRNRKEEYAMAVSAYGTLILGKSVCQGDAQAFNLLARKAGLNSIMSTGAIGDLSHAWNRVWANGQWYDLDCTYSLFCSNFEQYSASMGGVERSDNCMLASSMDDFYI